MEFWGSIIVGAFVLLMIRAWLVLGDIADYIEMQRIEATQRRFERLGR